MEGAEAELDLMEDDEAELDLMEEDDEAELDLMEEDEAELDLMEDDEEPDDSLFYSLCVRCRMKIGYCFERWEDPVSEYMSEENYSDVTDELEYMKSHYITPLLCEDILHRTLYPFDWMSDADESPSIPSLMYLCCAEVSRNSEYLERVSSSLPTNRYETFMKTPICYDSAAVLMSSWPSKSISLTVVDLVNLFRSATLYALWCWMSDVNLLIVRIVLLWRLFFDCVKKDSLRRLRELDLRGFPLDDTMVYFLLRHIMNLSKAVILTKDYHVIIDCVISSPQTFEKLKLFLSSRSKSLKFCIKLHINNIDLSALDIEKCRTLLRLIDSTDLIGLRIDSNFSPEFYVHTFTKFALLRYLDLSTSNSNESQMLPFELLPNLRRLAFRKREKDLSTAIPIPVLRRLDYFKLNVRFSEKGIEDDFRFLTSIPLILNELDLSTHVVQKRDLNVWRDLLSSLAATLTILNMFGCIKDDEMIKPVMSLVVPLVNLRCLIFGASEITLRTLYEALPILKVLKMLETIRLDCKGDFNFCRYLFEPITIPKCCEQCERFHNRNKS